MGMVLLLGLAPLPAQWNAFNDHASGPGTHPNTTRYNMLGAEDGTNGFLKDSLSGAALPVRLIISRSGMVMGDPLAGQPAPSTPMHTVFASQVDFASSPVENNVAMRTGGFVTFTFSGLDPAVAYRFRAGAVRGNANATNRWTLAELTGADSFTSSHTPGALTQAEVPGELASNQVALNFGANHTPATGDLMDWTDIRCGPDGEFSVVCTRYAGTVPNGSSGSATTFGYAPTALLLEELRDAPVAIVAHPAPQSILEGEDATFEVTATGRPIFFQWLREGTPIPEATNTSYTLSNAQLGDSGRMFSVVVSNQFNSATSNPALLVVTTPTAPMLSFTNIWRYDASGQDLGTAWKEPDYDDSAWPSGPGALGFDEAALPIPIRTTLINHLGATYYFRTEFTQSFPTSNVELLLTNLIDDGAVFYVDGIEVYRLGMPNGPITFATPANRTIGNATFETTRLFIENFSQGTHRLAAEVHQVNSISSDIVLGVAVAIEPVRPERLEFLSAPTNQVAFIGQGPVVFGARVLSGVPYQSQWFKDGAPLSGETNDELRLEAVSFSDRGAYWLSVSNAFAQAQTSAATLHVIPPVPGQTVVLEATNTWRYHAEGLDLGTAWRQPGFDDSGWLSGPGPLSTAGEPLPEPIGTVLPLTTPDSQRIITYYFRSTFVNPSAGGIFDLILSNLVDDGAVFYLNGLELGRVSMPPGTVTYNTLASVPADLGQIYQRLLAAQVPLLEGINSLAVEVHQGALDSSDIVFGTILRVASYAPEPVRFIRQPASQTVPLGYPALLTAEVFGSYPIDFQWYKDGLAVAEATNRDLSMPLTQTEDSGWYTLHATNAYGFDLSQPAFLDVRTDNYPWVSLLRGPYLQSCAATSIVVRWRTDVPCPSEVLYGTSPGALDHSVLEPVVSVEHEMRLEGLDPGTRYYYAIGSTHSNLADGDGCTFTTASDQPKPLRIWAQGDAGKGNADALAVSSAYFQFTGARETDVWLMLGDNAYEVGSDANYQSALFDLYPEFLRRTPLWLTPGNHDVFATERNGSHAYANIFTLPTQGEAGGVASGTEYYYSFNHGGVHFVSLDSETSEISPGAPMLEWLRADLDANTSDWLIAFWHSPPYSHGSHNSDNLSDSKGKLVLMRQYVVPILEAYGADVVLSGHSHSYERSFLLDGHYGDSASLRPEMILDAGNGRPAESGAYRKAVPGLWPGQGTVYIVAGSSSQVFPSPLDHPAMAVSLPRLGSVVLDIDGNRLDVVFVGATGQVEDSFTIIKDAPPEPLRFVSARLLDGQLVLSWKSVAQKLYQIDGSPRLEPAEWEPVSDWIAASGATTFWTNQGAASEPARFYRARTMGD